MENKDIKTVEGGRRDEQGLPEGFHVQLSFTTGPDRGMVKRLWKLRTVLGRDEAADITLSDHAASKQHLEILVQEKGLMVRDLGSTNGTRVNGTPINKAPLKNLDEIMVGDTTIKVAILEEASPLARPDSQIIIEEDPALKTTRPRPKKAGSPVNGELPAGYVVTLEVVEGPDQGRRYTFKTKAAIIGRAGADLVLSDPEVSRKHASIEFLTPARALLKDLRSRNGTLLNNRPITVAYLKHGDLIGAGGSVIRFSAFTAASRGGAAGGK
jgi:pSer/pThr/pTyr-binding forkhead associated (FHA) protein